jgi:hypothetical protein
MRPERCSVGAAIPLGEAAAAATAPAVVNASAAAAMSAVRLPLHREDSEGTAGTAVEGANRANGASWGTLSCTSACGWVCAWVSGCVSGSRVTPVGVVNPGGGDAGGTLTTSGSTARL